MKFNLKFACLVLALVAIKSTESAPIISKTDKNVAVDVSPFFKMNLLRDTSGMLLDIDVLSGLVKVGYDRLAGSSPNVDVEVFGLGSSRKRISDPSKETTDQLSNYP